MTRKKDNEQNDQQVATSKLKRSKRSDNLSALAKPVLKRSPKSMNLVGLPRKNVKFGLYNEEVSTVVYIDLEKETKRQRVPMNKKQEKNTPRYFKNVSTSQSSNETKEFSNPSAAIKQNKK